jgi:hypothetical protein
MALLGRLPHVAAIVNLQRPALRVNLQCLPDFALRMGLL